MNEIIKNELFEIEKKHSVKILYACESGSRAWGFPSTDSDYDVRFIYVQTMEKYLSISDIQDFINIPINDKLDINGWDIKKVLQLLRQSNASILEWITSPIVYIPNIWLKNEILELNKIYFSPKTLIHHYLGISKSALNTIENNKIRLKKLFYVLRPLLSAKWICENNEFPPIKFQKLCKKIDDLNIKKIIDELLKVKSEVDEGYIIDYTTEIHDFIKLNFEYCLQKSNEFSSELKNSIALDIFYRKIIFQEK